MARISGAGYRFGRFVLNLDRGCLQEDGRDIDLRPKAFAVLRTLVEHSGKLVAKDELIRTVWPNVIVNDDALTQCIRDVRKVLRDENERFIKTVPRRGYMFVAQTEPIWTDPHTGREGAIPPGGRNWTTAVIIGVSFAVALAALAGWSGGWFTVRPQPQDARLTIAVLPFANAGENPGEDWLGDGIADDIITAVSRFRDLTVIARNSSFRFRGDNADVQKIGQALSADFLLQGSLRRTGDQLRITVQLVDARTGAVRWSERYDRPFLDVFAIQDEVADSIAAQLVAQAREVTVARIRARRPENLAAYELVLRGRKAYLTFTREGALEGRALAEQAIAIDANYAATWDLLGRLLIQFYVQPYDAAQGNPATLQLARAAAEKAVALDPGFSTGHATLGFALAWAREHDAGLEALRKAIALNPNDVSATNIYADVLSLAGHHRESIEVWKRAERLDPFRPALALALKARAHVLLGEFQPALALTRSCAEQAPRLQPCFIFRAISASELGYEEEARAAARRVVEINPKFTTSAFLRQIPYRTQADVARLAEYLRRAGLPD